MEQKSMTKPNNNMKQTGGIIGLLFMSRARPGFDQEWGAKMKRSLRGFFDRIGMPVYVPAEDIKNDTMLRDAVASCIGRGVEQLVVTQPTMSDGRFAPILAQLWPQPMILWATPEEQKDGTVSSNSLVGTHLYAATMRHLHRPFEIMFGHPDDPTMEPEFQKALRIITAASALPRAKVGLIGNHAPGFIDFHTDPIALSRSLGTQLYHQSVNDFLTRVNDVATEEVKEDLEEVSKLGIPLDAIDRDALAFQSRYYLAVKGLMEEENLDGLALQCWSDLISLTGHWPYLAESRLASEGLAVEMEGDVDGAICALIARTMGIGPVYLSDWLEHDDEAITFWHAGAAPFQLCEAAGTPGEPQAGVHFNNGKPTVVDATLQVGSPVTLYRLWRCDDRYHLTALEGESVAPTRALPGTNGRVRIDVASLKGVRGLREWFDESVHRGMPHHVSIIRGNYALLLKHLARLMGWCYY